jgi:hypothetical protein
MISMAFEKHLGKKGPSYKLDKWVDFKSLANQTIYILSAWEVTGKFGPEVQFVFAASNGKTAGVYGSSTNSKTIIKQIMGVKADGELPAACKVEKITSDRSPTGYAWVLRDVALEEPDKTLIHYAVTEAMETSSSDALPEELPF